MQLALTRLEAVIERHLDHPNPLQAFPHGEHVERNIKLFTNGLMKNSSVICPLNSQRTVQFALMLPWEASTDYRFQDHAIAYRYPEFGDIPYSEGTQNVTCNWSPDLEDEDQSWEKLRKILVRVLSFDVVSWLDDRKARLETIHRGTLLAQAALWNECHVVPSAK